ncbi:kinase-like domain-containing protein [Xylaria nigripes]|nr:kinase-like domain-containing protein [Xylaria nigripes]
MNEKPFVASVYMEFCDRGTLEDLIKTYKIQKKIHSPARIPESFIWHAFVGLADALGYLQTGQSYVSTPLENNDPKKWRPIMHCDIKPGNIFLRSRDTPGSKKPFYVLLSDFGLVQYQDAHENTIPYVYGTSEFQSPELCFDPYPRESQRNIMAGPHTCKSDVWALAASMFGMCERDELAHMDRRCWPLRSLRALGRIAKRPVLNITDVGLYSEYLARAIAWAGNQDPSKRPDGWELVVKVKAQYDLWLADADWKTQVEVKGALPPEATKDIKALVIRNEQAEDLGNGAYYIS